jgi:hypothetical protein
MAEALNFPFGPFQAAESVTSLVLHLPDTVHVPTDPVLPPNPIFEFSPAAPVIEALGFQSPIVETFHPDLLI